MSLEGGREGKGREGRGGEGRGGRGGEGRGELEKKGTISTVNGRKRVLLTR